MGERYTQIDASRISIDLRLISWRPSGSLAKIAVDVAEAGRRRRSPHGRSNRAFSRARLSRPGGRAGRAATRHRPGPRHRRARAARSTDEPEQRPLRPRRAALRRGLRRPSPRPHGHGRGRPRGPRHGLLGQERRAAHAARPGDRPRGRVPRLAGTPFAASRHRQGRRRRRLRNRRGRLGAGEAQQQQPQRCVGPRARRPGESLLLPRLLRLLQRVPGRQADGQVPLRPEERAGHDPQDLAGPEAAGDREHRHPVRGEPGVQQARRPLRHRPGRRHLVPRRERARRAAPHPPGPPLRIPLPPSDVPPGRGRRARAGRERFGPPEWEGDAIVTGFSRGKLWRVPLAKTRAGYLGRPVVLASFRSLPVDVALSPKGDLVVACHGGKPDWGSGPNGEGKLWKLSWTGKTAPQPVIAWPTGPLEVKVAFDRPVAGEAQGATLEGGEFVRAGDRFETIRPGYKVVAEQQRSPRHPLRVHSLQPSEDRRTLTLLTAAHPWRATYG